ncbi:unnamed protein product [Spirodela intermedia]|uniref:S-acyltransferase n=1 Tax=Spirodela intermedia TaxID=51605 RepID=A0A7I8KP70_SPIIN|nr:unnamed protein product [Spirodela intermedia]
MVCCRRVNPFRFCSGLRFLGYSMILLVAAVVALSYYAVVVVAWGPHLLRGGSSSVLAFSVVIIFHILLVLLIWSYVMVVIKDPGSVPENWRPILDEENVEVGTSGTLSDIIAPELRASSWSPSGRRPDISYCSRCQNNKPPRCHHCSVCQRCVLKMDHHCVWVVNCVGARNYKFFLLFLVYTFLETCVDTIVLLPRFIRFFQDAKIHSISPGNLAVVFLAFVLNLAFALSLLCFLIMHTSLLLSNTTTIEVYEKRQLPRWKYDLGKKKNFEQVFGTHRALWFLPLYSPEDLQSIPFLQGLDFPTRPDEDDDG